MNALQTLDKARLFTDPDSDGGQDFRAELAEARAAVAELVEAAKAINVAITCGGHEARINRSNPLSVETLRAALAKFGAAG